jgi:hypothetical protein
VFGLYTLRAGTDESLILAITQNRRLGMAILKDRNGNPQGVIQEVAGGKERLVDLGGKVIATYRTDTDWTYDKNGVRIATGNRLAGMVGDDE